MAARVVVVGVATATKRGSAGAARRKAAAAKTITVSGVGSAAVVPDTAAFSFCVQTHSRSASEALARNALETDQIIAALHEVGVAAGDIQADLSAISPEHADDGETIIGYRVENTLTASVQDVERAGPAIDAAVRAGATPAPGPVLSPLDRATLAREALQAAFVDACAKAETLASAAGIAVGRVVEMIEGGAAWAAEPTSRLEAQVTVTFALAERQ